MPSVTSENSFEEVKSEDEIDWSADKERCLSVFSQKFSTKLKKKNSKKFLTLEKEQIESALVEAFQKLDDGVSEGPAKEGVIHIDITDDVIKPQNVKNDVTKKNDDFIAQSPTNSWTVVDEDFGYEQI